MDELSSHNGRARSRSMRPLLDSSAVTPFSFTCPAIQSLRYKRNWPGIKKKKSVTAAVLPKHKDEKMPANNKFLSPCPFGWLGGQSPLWRFALAAQHQRHFLFPSLSFSYCLASESLSLYCMARQWKRNKEGKKEVVFDQPLVDSREADKLASRLMSCEFVSPHKGESVHALFLVHRHNV